MEDCWLTARVPLNDRRKLDQLARKAGMSRSAALRALLQAADHIDPARIVFVPGDNNGTDVSQARGAAVA